MNIAILTKDTHILLTTHQWVSATEHTVLVQGCCRLDFECSPSTPETLVYADTQAGLA